MTVTHTKIFMTAGLILVSMAHLVVQKQLMTQPLIVIILWPKQVKIYLCPWVVLLP